jgi:hypothetical protein
MRIPTPAGYAIAAAASIALLAGCSGGSSGMSGSTLPTASGSTASTSSLRGPQVRSLKQVTPVPGKIMAQLPANLHRPIESSYKHAVPNTTCYPYGYLSGNLTGKVYAFARPTSSTYTTLSAASGQLYGWGVAADASTIYIGTDIDTIDTVAPCGTSINRGVYHGNATGEPYGMDVNPATGCLAADEWATTTVDIFCAPGGPGSGSGPVTDQLITYFIAFDRSGGLWAEGYNTAGSSEQTDKCPTGLPASCTPFAEISGGFPGGVAVDKNGNVIVNNQFGSINTYNSSGTLLSTFTYSNGTNPLDYTAIRLSKGGLANKEGHVWGANIYLCSTCSFGIGTNAQNQGYDPSTGTVGPLDPASGAISNDEALGLALYQNSNQP